VVDKGGHGASVDAWLERSAKDLSSEALLSLLEAAFGALWARTNTTLGEVTLSAITERVLYNASETFPLFSSLKVDPTEGLRSDGLRERLGSVPSSEMREGSRLVLVQFLTVLGNLTAEILTSELHGELSKVALPEKVRVEQGAQSEGKGS
jgi:hypothetical protein